MKKIILVTILLLLVASAGFAEQANDSSQNEISDPMPVDAQSQLNRTMDGMNSSVQKNRVDDLERTVTNLQRTLSLVKDDLDRLEVSFREVERKTESVDRRMGDLESNFRDVERRVGR